MNIFLIGYRCSGKTSVGKLLAGRLGWTFVDTDADIVSEHGLTIADMVVAQGWKSFREKEKAVIKRRCTLDQTVVATGGGAILDSVNVDLMKAVGTLVWLKAHADTVKERIFKDANTDDQRPSLTAKGLLEEIEETLAVRDPYYQSAMDFSVDTDDRSIDEISERIMEHLNLP